MWCGFALANAETLLSEVLRGVRVVTPARSRKKERQERQRRRYKTRLILLVLLMLLAVAAGMYLASKGLHPRQLRRRRIPHPRNWMIQEVPVLQSLAGIEARYEIATRNFLSGVGTGRKSEKLAVRQQHDAGQSEPRHSVA